MQTTRKKQLLMLVLTGLMAAFVAVATMLIHIPTPTKGYINLGDCLVNLSAWMLGPLYGACAAGIGSGLADLFLGYAVYAPATLVIKALMAVLSFYVFRLVSKRTNGVLSRTVAAVSAEVLMIAGYCVFEAFLYGSFAVALTGVPSNVAQGVGGAAISVVLHEVLLRRIPAVKSLES